MLQTILTCIELFPISLKSVVAAKQTGSKRDSTTHMLELCLFIVEQGTNETMKIRQRFLLLQILSKLHLAREKARTAYNDTLMRAVTNFIMYVDVTKPRSFDAEDLTKELPQDVMIGFLF